MYHFHELDLIFSDQATPPGKYVPVAPGIDFRITKGYPIPRMAVEHIYKPYLQRFCELQLARHKILNGGDRWLRD
ncbi:MAG: hypothetical protein GWN86_15665, partial [Desulfobacterales bacterium]|nr:hypothetical protein [Desulfobacterales bacterium]